LVDTVHSIGFNIPLRTSQRPLFESIMPVVIAIWTVFFAVVYLLRLESGFQKEGIVIGMAWFFISIFLDLLVFIEGPIKMSLWIMRRIFP